MVRQFFVTSTIRYYETPFVVSNKWTLCKDATRRNEVKSEKQLIF